MLKTFYAAHFNIVASSDRRLNTVNSEGLPKRSYEFILPLLLKGTMKIAVSSFWTYMYVYNFYVTDLIPTLYQMYRFGWGELHFHVLKTIVLNNFYTLCLRSLFWNYRYISLCTSACVFVSLVHNLVWHCLIFSQIFAEICSHVLS